MFNEEYLFTTGVIRSREAKLLSSVDIERIVDAKTAEEALKVFNDTDYADELPDIEKPEDFNQGLLHDQKQARDLMEKIIPDRTLIKFLFLRYDYHNIKLLFKAKFSGQELDKNASDLGNISYDILKTYILKEEDKGVLPEIKGSIDRAREAFEKDQTPFFIDLFLDKEYYRLLRELTEKLKCEFVDGLVSDQIDMVNVDAFLRVREMARPLEFLERVLVEGGAIPQSIFLEYFEKSEEEFFRHLPRYLGDRKLQQELEESIKARESYRRGKIFEEYEVRYLGRAKFIAYGPEIVVAYYLAKNNAIRNIRLIMIGKVNGIPANEIRQRVREIY